jgi:hypothetical protein
VRRESGLAGARGDLHTLLGGHARGDIPAVAVAGHAVDRSERPELVEQRRVDDVARMQDAVRLSAGCEQCSGQRAAPARPEVRIARDDDP